MTHNPGDEPDPKDPRDPAGEEPPEPGREPGYWEQSAQPPTAPYPQQPYPQQPYPQGYPGGGPVQYAPDHPRATTSLVLGILGVVLCQVLGPVAWWMGKKTLEEIDASGGRVGGRGAAQAGYIMGIIGTVLLVLGLVVLVVYAVFFVVLLGGSLTTTSIG